MPGKDIFELKGAAGKGDYNLSHLSEEKIVSAFNNIDAEGTNPLKKAHALMVEEKYFIAKWKSESAGYIGIYSARK